MNCFPTLWENERLIYFLVARSVKDEVGEDGREGEIRDKKPVELCTLYNV